MAQMYSQGTTFQISTNVNSPADFSTIGNVQEVSAMGVTRNLIETTNIASTIEENLLGIPRGGEVTLRGTYDQADAGQLECKESAQTGTPAETRQFKVTLPLTGSGDVITFTIIPLGWQLGPVGTDGKVDFEFRFKIASLPAYA